MRAIRPVVFVLTSLALTWASAARAQAPVTAADLTRLESTAAEISTRVDALKQTDPTLAGDVSHTLSDLSDEITYLKVKMRREGSVTREEYSSLRDRLETLRIKAQGEKVSGQPVAADDPSATRGNVTTVPVGTEFDVRLQSSLDSGTATAEQRFEATTVLDYIVGRTVVVPAGSTVRGFVSSVRSAGKLDRRAGLTLSFDELRVDSTSYRLRATVTRAFDGKLGDDTARIGAGAAVGAIIGGILGGGKGALLGVLVGGGGTMAATGGTEVSLPAGTILRIKLDEPLQIPVPGAAPAAQ
jgi:hypothetical protein